MSTNPQDLLTGIYSDWDLVSDQEKDKVNACYDKLSSLGSLSPLEIKHLKKLLWEIKKRGKSELQDSED